MKKIILFFALLISVNLCANAQYVGNKFFDNWGAGVYGGTIGSFNKPDNYFGGAQRPMFGIELTKQLTPVFALAVQGEGIINTTASKTAIDQVFVFGVGKINIMNLFDTYAGKPRVFELEAVLGPGWGHQFGNAWGYKQELLAKAGMNVNFNLGAKRAWTVGVKPAVVWDLHESQFNQQHMFYELIAGVTYHFKTSNGQHYMTCAKLYDQAEIDALNGKINDLNAQLAKKPTVIVKENTKTIVNVVDKTSYVAFAQNSATLDTAAKAVLDNVKSGTTVDIVAGATVEGTKAYNQKLSEKRAKVVADYLTTKGVKVASTTGIGGSKTGQRIAIVTVK